MKNLKQQWSIILTVAAAFVFAGFLTANAAGQDAEFYAQYNLPAAAGTMAMEGDVLYAGGEVRIESPSYTIDGKSTQSLAKGRFAASVPLRNESSISQKNVCVILAIYRDGQLEQMHYSEDLLAPGESKTVTVSEEIKDEAGYTAKLMVWDSIKNMIPYSEMYLISSEAEPTPSASASTPTPTPTSSPTAKPLSIPAELAAAENSYTGVKLTWKNTEGETITGYKIYRKLTDEADYTQLAELSADAAEYTDTLIRFNSSYEYAVQSFNENGQSEYAKLTVNTIEGASVLMDKFDGKNTWLEGQYIKLNLAQNPANPDPDSNSYSEFIEKKADANGIALDCVSNINDKKAGRYWQIAVNDEYIESKKDSRVAVVVTYLDTGTDTIKMQYNAADGNNFKGANIVKKTNTGLWKTAVYVLEDADFRQVGNGFDLRLNFDNPSTNYFAMVQLVNLADKFGAVAEDTDKILLSWQRAIGVERYKLYRDDQQIASFDANEREYLDSGLEEGAEYSYRLIAVVDGTEHEVASIKAATQKYIVAEQDFDSGISRGMELVTDASITDELVDGVMAKIASDTENTVYKFKIDNHLASGRRNRLLTIKYNDCGYSGNVRVSMINPAIDAAHYFRTNGSNKWETATVLIPDAEFKNNENDLQIKTLNEKMKFAISSVRLSDVGSISFGGKEMTGIASGVTVFENALNTTLGTVWLTNSSTAAADAENNIILDTSNVGTNNLKDPTIRVIPDYRYLGQNYGNAVLPGENGYDEKPAQVRSIDVRITYQKANKNGAIKIKGAKLRDNKIVHDTVDKELSLIGDGEWVTEQFTLDDFYVQGKSIDVNTYIEFACTGVPADETVHIKNIEIYNNDPGFTAEYKKELGAVVIDWNISDGDAYEIYRNGKLLTTVSALPYRDTDFADGDEFTYAVTAYKDGELLKSGTGLKYVKIDGIAPVDESVIQLGQYVQMGTYNGEPILWRCAGYEKISGETASGEPVMDALYAESEYRAGYLPIMVADKIICMKPFDAAGEEISGSHGRGYGDSRKNYGSNYWGDSNLRDWLNSDKPSGEIVWSCGNIPDHANGGVKASYADENGFLTNFSAVERSAMYTVNQKLLLDGGEDPQTENTGIQTKFDIENAAANYRSAYSEQISDTVFLPDIQQVVNIDRNGAALGQDWYIGHCTEKCKSVHSDLIFGRKWADSYWLRTPASFEESSSNVRTVTDTAIPTHTISYAPAYSGTQGVRPAFFINQTNIQLTGNGTMEEPFTVVNK